MGEKETGICIMDADVEFALWPTRVPCVAQERFSSREGSLNRRYYCFVSWGLWRDLRQMCSQGEGNNTSL